MFMSSCETNWCWFTTAQSRNWKKQRRNHSWNKSACYLHTHIHTYVRTGLLGTISPNRLLAGIIRYSGDLIVYSRIRLRGKLSEELEALEAKCQGVKSSSCWGSRSQAHEIRINSGCIAGGRVILPSMIASTTRPLGRQFVGRASPWRRPLLSVPRSCPCESLMRRVRPRPTAGRANRKERAAATRGQTDGQKNEQADWRRLGVRADVITRWNRSRLEPATSATEADLMSHYNGLEDCQQTALGWR